MYGYFIREYNLQSTVATFLSCVLTDYILLLWMSNVKRVGNEAKNGPLKRFLDC